MAANRRSASGPPRSDTLRPPSRPRATRRIPPSFRVACRIGRRRPAQLQRAQTMLSSLPFVVIPSGRFGWETPQTAVVAHLNGQRLTDPYATHRNQVRRSRAAAAGNATSIRAGPVQPDRRAHAAQHDDLARPASPPNAAASADAASQAKACIGPPSRSRPNPSPCTSPSTRDPPARCRAGRASRQSLGGSPSTAAGMEHLVGDHGRRAEIGQVAVAVLDQLDPRHDPVDRRLRPAPACRGRAAGRARDARPARTRRPARRTRRNASVLPLPCSPDSRHEPGRRASQARDTPACAARSRRS